MDDFTPMETWSATDAIGAQRLSASWTISLHGPRARKKWLSGCSTPVGVMDDFTVQGHQHTVDGHCAAQRPSASWTISPGCRRLACLVLVVLNACRRHGRFHYAGSCQRLATWRVLNACRRHGRFHSMRCRCSRGRTECSTPVGVMDDFTEFASLVQARRNWCSTPVGVMDDFTAFSRLTTLARICAQRLSASWTISRGFSRRRVAFRVGAQRLSASWTISHGRYATLSIQIVRAQRLSASWTISTTPEAGSTTR